MYTQVPVKTQRSNQHCVRLVLLQNDSYKGLNAISSDDTKIHIFGKTFDVVTGLDIFSWHMTWLKVS